MWGVLTSVVFSFFLLLEEQGVIISIKKGTCANKSPCSRIKNGSRFLVKNNVFSTKVGRYFLSFLLTTVIINESVSYIDKNCRLSFLRGQLTIKLPCYSIITTKKALGHCQERGVGVLRVPPLSII